jgi:hypothetical protein
MNESPTIKPGTYRHYKGKLYTVLDVARHSETREFMVAYRAQYDKNSLWVRPYTMFTEKVEVNGKQVPRFKFLHP